VNILAEVLISGGIAVCLLSCLSLVLLPTAYEALHAVTPVTSLGTPLVIAGLAINDATLHGVAKLILIALLIMLSGPAVSVATARAERAQAGGE
jgi:monovalent cation/proton antiporter MnhG/PhaG subunit